MQDLVMRNPEALLRSAHRSGAEVLPAGFHFLITEVKSEEEINTLC